VDPEWLAVERDFKAWMKYRNLAESTQQIYTSAVRELEMFLAADGRALAPADVRQQVALSLLTDFENFSVFKAGEYSLAALNTMLDQLVAWTSALAPLRQLRDEAAA